ncbi:BREX system P-loop protein BrxC [Pseudoalteromonas sp. MEBiC 03485]|uniref:BREX system P-loop protein BrxC n=1 Tax=Pseudoalteromonas sp. MEBiC 03485 TaxID=2571103 RepID=UPI001021D5EB|nr:BREX system P-loop protein BrxC [Pseudoalteromonas sp. MEBiC 03485]RZD20082.1 BREX system P-loop protein BrxC [Pseudoalteromonas sp. MEBiC 03485]
MQIKDLFIKDINRPINGVVKADQLESNTVFTELDEYVITKELATHFEEFFDAYMPSVRDPKKKAESGKIGVWVSGFFGSGKSHFIKILSYLLQNIKATNGEIDRSAIEFFKDKKLDGFLLGEIDTAVTKDNTVILFNIDSRANTDDGVDAILKVFLKVFNEQMGFSGDYPHIAHLERELFSKGLFESFKNTFYELTDLSWVENRDSYGLYLDDITEVLSKVTNQSLESTRKWMDQLENNFTLDIANFCKWVKEYLDTDLNRRVLFFVDEVGQFIGNNTQMMLKLQTITENLGTICEGRAWVVVTSQEDIDSVIGHMAGSKGHDFSKIQGRFERLSLSSSNTSEVIEKRLLSKQEQARPVLQTLYDQKGDILRNQLAFDSTTTAELANYKDATSFIHSYPFVPYHYNLVQKIFEAIRKAGATGLHLSRGERSLLDAFQSAAKQVRYEEVGVLIPLYYFYPAIESFLDTSVKKDIDQAAEKDSISDFALNILKTLFLIRYVDVIKSTMDNLVTLCVSKVDEDRLTLRRDIEQALNALEANLLIARQGDEYIFLTNEEKEIENEIRETEIELSDETKKLSDLIFDDVLRRDNIYRYPENKQDFPISRFCNGMPRDGSQENDLVVKIISPIDPNYGEYDPTVCANQSQDGLSSGGAGAIIIKLADNNKVFDEIRTFIKTDKFLRRNTGNRPEQQQLLHQKGSENQDRNRRVKLAIEDLLKDAEFYALGSQQNPKGGAISTILQELYKYVIENTFSKLKLVKPFPGDIRREIQNTLVADDIGQIGLDLQGQEANPLAVLEVEKFISLGDDAGRPITAEDIVKRFSKRPFGWNDEEIVLITSRLALANKICFQSRQQDVSLKNAYDNLMQVRKRAELRVRRIKQQSEANLKRAAKLFKDVFQKNAPESEKELFNVAQSNFANIKSKLDAFANKASTGHYPGVSEIESGRVLLAGLIETQSSFQFIEQFLACENDLLDFEEDYQDIEDFYETQFATWQKLQRALTIDFDRNRTALEKDTDALTALQKLENIYNKPRPYREIKDIEPLIESVSKVNEQLLQDKRAHAKSRIEHRIEQVQKQITAAHVPSELSNKALRPLQLALQRLGGLSGIAEILQEQADSINLEEEAYDLINKHIEAQQALAAKQAKEAVAAVPDSTSDSSANPSPASGSTSNTGSGGYEPSTTEPQQVAEPAVNTPIPKKIVSIDTASIIRDVNATGVIETEQDIDAYLAVLKEKLTTLVNSNNKVRIR